MTNRELQCTVAINKIFCYNPRLSNALFDEFGSFEPLFNMTYSQLKERFGKHYHFFDLLCDKNTIDWAEDEIRWASSERIKIISRSSPEYPTRVVECADPPALLYVKGDIDLNRKRIISIVGTRMPTRYGIESCRHIVGELKENGSDPAVVSGLAYGIDVSAHKAALDNGLDTIAVLPGGLDNIYPAAHNEISDRIARHGALVTEFPRYTDTRKINFVQRNRIIAALSDVTVVVESKERGGALITAELAHSYSREVFALPGKISDICSQGCNNLIAKNIANIFTSVNNMTEYLGWESKPKPKITQGKLFCQGNTDKEKIVVALNNESELTKNDLFRLCNLGLPLLSSLLLEMELEGTIISLPGDRYCILRH